MFAFVFFTLLAPNLVRSDEVHIENVYIIGEATGLYGTIKSYVGLHSLDDVIPVLTLPSTSDVGKVKVIHLSGNSVDYIGMYHYLINYPCDSIMREKFRQYQSTIVNGDKQTVLTNFLTANPDFRLELYVNTVSYLQRCNLQPFAYVKNQKFSCVIDNKRACHVFGSCTSGQFAPIHDMVLTSSQYNSHEEKCVNITELQ